MAVLVGSARIDENGNAHGGKAGDQRNEVSTQAWYKHGLGWIVLRPTDKTDAELIAQDMEAACNNPNVGYDQYQRNTLYTAAAKVGFNIAKVTRPVETDCSALVRVCLAYAGIMVGDFTTGNEAKVLIATGKFKMLTAKKYTESSQYLERGDVLVTASRGHTVVVLSNGSKVQAAVTKPKTLDQIVDEVIAGKWGNGGQRERLLRAAGYVPEEVQAAVNAKLRAQAAKVQPVYYTIKRGDTLSGIARKYGTTVRALANMNGISNVNRIVAGHRIRVK